MLDHGDGTGRPGLVEQALQGHLPSALTRDDILDNITLYWLTNTEVSSARLYWENEADFFDARPITIPFGISVFPTSSSRPRAAGPSERIPATPSTKEHRQRRPFRRLGTVRPVHRRNAGRIPVTAVKGGQHERPRRERYRDLSLRVDMPEEAIAGLRRRIAAAEIYRE
jgi:hypothetical protein